MPRSRVRRERQAAGKCPPDPAARELTSSAGPGSGYPASCPVAMLAGVRYRE